MTELPFRCPKCDHTEYETRHFTTLTCARCRYTEMYQAESSTLGSVFDFFTN